MHQSRPKKHNRKTKTSSSSSGVVRIIGGQMRGRKLRFHGSQGLRPTLDRVRETLFNWLARDIQQAICLDLFAGSGALGFEAISRGAGFTTFVEKNHKVSQDIKSNLSLLHAENAKVFNLSAAEFLKTNQQKYDLVFLDPPFGMAMLNDILPAIIPHLNQDALLYIEQEKSEDPYLPDNCWQVLKQKSTGSFSYALYRYTENNTEPVNA